MFAHTDTAAGYTDQLHPTVADGIPHLKLSDTLQAAETSPQNGNSERCCDSLAWVPNIHLSLVIYIATQSNGQTSQPHSTNITGSATTPEMPPIFNQKCELKFTNHAIKVVSLYVFWS